VALLTSLLAAPASADAAARCCQALRRLALNDDMDAAAIVHGAHKHTLRHLGSYAALAGPASAALVEAGVEGAKLLSDITISSAGQKAAVAANGMQPVMDALFSASSPLSGHPEANGSLLSALACMVGHSESTRIEAVSRGALQACVAYATGPMSGSKYVSIAVSILAQCLELPVHVTPALDAGVLGAALARVEHPASAGTTVESLRLSTRVLGYISCAPDGAAALAAGDKRAVRAVAALRSSSVAIAHDAKVAAAAEWATDMFRAAGVALAVHAEAAATGSGSGGAGGGARDVAAVAPAPADHCAHCFGGASACACAHLCPRPSTSACTSVRHCSHCAGHAASCACSAGCARPGGAWCTPRVATDTGGRSSAAAPAAVVPPVPPAASCSSMPAAPAAPTRSVSASAVDLGTIAGAVVAHA
jgi:hypothetical protein